MYVEINFYELFTSDESQMYIANDKQDDITKNRMHYVLQLNTFDLNISLLINIGLNPTISTSTYHAFYG